MENTSLRSGTCKGFDLKNQHERKTSFYCLLGIFSAFTVLPCPIPNPINWFFWGVLAYETNGLGLLIPIILGIFIGVFNMEYDDENRKGSEPISGSK